ncbi:MAG: hypothetical protein WCY24_04550, partial [Lutispora sp.]
SSDKLERLVLESGGKYIKDSSEVFQGSIAPVRGRLDLTFPMLLLALFTFLADIALRRLKLPVDRLARWFASITNMIMINKKEKKVKAIEKDADLERKTENHEEKQKKIIKEGTDKETKNEKSKTAGSTLDTAALLKSKKNK